MHEDQVPATNGGDKEQGEKEQEIFSHESSSMVYAMGWSERRDKRFRLAVGSLREGDKDNRVEILQLDEEKGKLLSTIEFAHEYPPTKLMWCPDREGTSPDLIATTGEYLRIWRLDEQEGKLERLLNNNQSEFCAPLTSFDWNEVDKKRLGTSSIDTTCTIWDIERGEVDTQLIAHDKEVYDIAWGGLGVFATVSADGSVRVFDLRDKEHSTIIYESPIPDTPLMRLGWNKQDPRFIATVMLNKVIVLDIRRPTFPVGELTRHQGPVNSISWAPHSIAHICTASDDQQALIWDLSSIHNANGTSHQGAADAQGLGLDPILAYNAGQEVNQLQWSSAHPDWVAIGFSNKTQILRV